MTGHLATRARYPGVRNVGPTLHVAAVDATAPDTRPASHALEPWAREPSWLHPPTVVGVLRRSAGAIQNAPATRGLYALCGEPDGSDGRAPTLRRGWTGRLSDIRHRAATDVPVAADRCEGYPPPRVSTVRPWIRGSTGDAQRGDALGRCIGSWVPGALPMRDSGRLAAWDRGPGPDADCPPRPLGPFGPTARPVRATDADITASARGDLAADDLRERGDARGR